MNCIECRKGEFCGRSIAVIHRRGKRLPSSINARQRPGGRFGAFANLAGNPDFQKLLAVQMKGRINQTYGPLFKALNLSPEQLTPVPVAPG